MTCIKFCGIRRPETIEVINRFVEEPLKYMGFVLAPSRRQVSFTELKELGRLLSPRFVKVGVFVNPTTSELERGLEAGIQVFQFHGDETEESIGLQVKDLFGSGTPQGFQIWKALKVGKNGLKSIESLKTFERPPLVDKYLLDKLDPSVYGGTGETFDWTCLGQLPIENHKVVIAGGLHEGNVKTLLKSYQPSVIDLSSGIETAGEKDEKKMVAFLKAFKESSGIQSQTML